MPPRSAGFARARQARQKSSGRQQPSHEPHSPPPSAGGARDDSGARRRSSSSSSPFLAPLPISIAGGDESVLACWFFDLQAIEKRDVLSVSAPELRQEVSLAFGPRAAVEDADVVFIARRAEALLSDSQYATALRRAFVNALHSEGQMDCTGLQTASEQLSDDGVDPVCTLLVTVMEAHLLSAYQRKQALLSLSVIAAFYCLSVCALPLVLRLPALALLVPLIYISSAQTAGPVHDADPHPHLRAFQARLVALIIPLFEHPRAPSSLSPTLLSVRVEACCAWLLLASWASHYSLAQYYLLLLLCALPLLLLHVHVLLLPTGYRLCGAERSLLLASSGCTKAMIAWLLWLSWSSWIELSFCLLFFLPTVTRIALSSVGVLVATILVPLLGVLQTKAGLDYGSRPILLLCLYLLSIAALAFYSYPSSSLLLLLFNLCVTVLLTPPLVLSAVSVVGASTAHLVLTLGVNKLLALLVELLLLVLLAAAVWLADCCWPLLLRVWQRTGAARWWKLHVMGGGALWRLSRAAAVASLWLLTKWRESSIRERWKQRWSDAAEAAEER